MHIVARQSSAPLFVSPLKLATVSVDKLTSRIALPRLWRDLSGNLIVPFRYDAPLSNGLDIVRRSLGRHEIAMIQ